MSIRLSAVGDSLTHGTGYCGATTPWPTLLDQTGQYSVKNFGAIDPSGAHEVTAASYKSTPEFAQLMESDPTIVTIMLGTFDATDTFVENDFVDSLRSLLGRCRGWRHCPTSCC